MEHLGDITLIRGHELTPMDVVVGGSPCQDLSQAGGRAGGAWAEAGNMRLGDLDAVRSLLLNYYPCANENTAKHNYMGDTLMSYEVADMIMASGAGM